MAQLNEEFVKKFKQIIALREIMNDMSRGHFTLDSDVISLLNAEEFLYLANALECLITKKDVSNNAEYMMRFHYCFKYRGFKIMHFSDEDLEVNV